MAFQFTFTCIYVWFRVRGFLSRLCANTLVVDQSGFYSSRKVMGWELFLNWSPRLSVPEVWGWSSAHHDSVHRNCGKTYICIFSFKQVFFEHFFLSNIFSSNDLSWQGSLRSAVRKSVVVLLTLRCWASFIIIITTIAVFLIQCHRDLSYRIKLIWSTLSPLTDVWPSDATRLRSEVWKFHGGDGPSLRQHFGSWNPAQYFHDGWLSNILSMIIQRGLDGRAGSWPPYLSEKHTIVESQISVDQYSWSEPVNWSAKEQILWTWT